MARLAVVAPEHQPQRVAQGVGTAAILTHHRAFHCDVVGKVVLQGSADRGSDKKAALYV